jgi:hypothetical protein
MLFMYNECIYCKVFKIYEHMLYLKIRINSERNQYIFKIKA